MTKVRVEYRDEAGVYYHGMRRATESVHGNLTFRFQGPFVKALKMISDDKYIYAVKGRGGVKFDPESGRRLSGPSQKWVKVGRVVHFVRGDVYFIGEDDVPCFWETEGYPKRVEKWSLGEVILGNLAAHDGEVFVTKNGKIIIEIPFQDEAQAREALEELLDHPEEEERPEEVLY